MEELQVVGSGSKGNTYLLKTSKQVLILDLGCKWEDILEAINYDLSNVSSCLVTHLHKDHSKSIPIALKYQLPVYSCQNVVDKFTGVIPLFESKKYKIGDFTVQPINVYHNVENYAYVIDHEEMGRLLFITDCVRFPYRIKGCNHILCECNYSNDIIIDNMMQNYDIRSQNQFHMELEDTIECIRNNISTELNTLIICHLSLYQSDENMFKQRIHDEFGIMPYVADKGLKIELNKEEF